MMHSRSSNARISRAPMFGNSRGAALMSALLVMAVLTILGMTAITTTSLGSKIAGNYRTASQAFYTAEAGLRRAAGQLKADPLWVATLGDTNDAFSGDSTLGDSTYVVAAFQDDPNPGEVRVRSTGTVTGASGASATVEAVVLPGIDYPIFDYAVFACTGFQMNAGNNTIRNADVFVGADAGPDYNTTIENGDFYAIGNIDFKGNSRLLGGDLFSNINIALKSAAAPPNVDGNVTAAGAVSDIDAGEVTGTITDYAPAPVPDLCAGPNVAQIAITAEDIQSFRDDPSTTTIVGEYDVADAPITYTGIVHITGDLKLTGTITLTGNVIFIVDGAATITGPGSIESSPPGSVVTFLVPNQDFKIKGGNFEIDGIVQAGTVNDDGTGLTGGKIQVNSDSTFTVNGSVVVVNNELKSDGELTVNYASPSDENIARAFTIKHWHQVYN